jgi:hypothetical protein
VLDLNRLIENPILKIRQEKGTKILAGRIFLGVSEAITRP